LPSFLPSFLPLSISGVLKPQVLLVFILGVEGQVWNFRLA
jgi:hypothetical protein